MPEQVDYIVGVGAANFDISGKSRAPIVMRDSNPGHFSTCPGGVTRNILDNLSKLGMKTHLLTALGYDAFGEVILRDCRRVGINTTSVLRVDHPTSSYISVLDDAGDMLVAMSDMSILEEIPSSYLDEHASLIRNAAAVVCDPGLPLELIKHLVTMTAGYVPLFTDPVSTSYEKKLLGITGGFFCIKPNWLELSILAGMEINTAADLESACDRLLDSGTKQVVVTLGGEGCFYKDRYGTRIAKKLREVKSMVNATGGGDAFSALILYGYVNRLTVEETIDLALAAGIAAITSESTINPDLALPMLREIVRTYAI